MPNTISDYFDDDSLGKVTNDDIFEVPSATSNTIDIIIQTEDAREFRRSSRIHNGYLDDYVVGSTSLTCPDSMQKFINYDWCS